MTFAFTLYFLFNLLFLSPRQWLQVQFLLFNSPYILGCGLYYIFNRNLCFPFFHEYFYQVLLLAIIIDASK